MEAPKERGCGLLFTVPLISCSFRNRVSPRFPIKESALVSLVEGEISPHIDRRKKDKQQQRRTCTYRRRRESLYSVSSCGPHLIVVGCEAGMDYGDGTMRIDHLFLKPNQGAPSGRNNTQ